MKARLHLQTALRGSHSFLKEAFFTPPFKVADITEDKTAPLLELMLMSSSPGMLDEDDYQLDIHLAAGTALRLHTQSYQRLFPMQQGATQQMTVRLEPGASFCFLPHPSVPHAGARYTAINQIHLSPGATLLWGEIITCGRRLNGEVFRFTHYRSRTDIYLDNKLVLRENMHLAPAGTNITAMGLWEGYTHQASLICLDESAITEEHLQAINTFLATQEDILHGISRPPVNGLVIRLLGYKAEQLFHCLRHIAAILSPLSKSSAYAY